MPTEQLDKEYGNRLLKRSLVTIFSLMAIGLMAIPTMIVPNHVTLAGYIVVGTWLLALAIGVFWVTRLRSNYHCPRCGAALPPLKAEKRTKFYHRFLCKSCDVIWTTNVTDQGAS
jgi:hypothetical protein